MDRHYGLPGSRYVNTDFARMLARQNLNNGTTAGGLGHTLQEALLGYIQGQERDAMNKDKTDQTAAYQALAQGMQPTAGTPQGGHPGLMDVPAQPGSPGGYQGAVGALQGLQDNQYAGRLASDLMMKKFEADQAAKAAETARQNGLTDYEKKKTIDQKYAAPRPPMAVSPGATLVDPNTGQPIFAAPAQPKYGVEVPYPPEVAAQRQEIAAAGRPVWTTTTDPNTGVPIQVNQMTGEQKSAPGQKPMTDSQSAAALYADRMRGAESILSNPALVQAGLDPRQALSASVPGVGNYMVSPEYQQLEQAQRDFLNAVLRRESGAVIGPTEFESGKKQYFPQPGDSPETIAQKAKNRILAIEGISRAAGATYKPMGGNSGADLHTQGPQTGGNVPNGQNPAAALSDDDILRLAKQRGIF